MRRCPSVFLNRTWISTHIPHGTQARGTGLEITAMYKQLFNDTLNTFLFTVHVNCAVFILILTLLILTHQLVPHLCQTPQYATMVLLLDSDRT